MHVLKLTEAEVAFLRELLNSVVNIPLSQARGAAGVVEKLAALSDEKHGDNPT